MNFNDQLARVTQLQHSIDSMYCARNNLYDRIRGYDLDIKGTISMIEKEIEILKETEEYQGSLRAIAYVELAEDYLNRYRIDES